MICNVYHDGSHYVAYEKIKSKRNFEKGRKFNEPSEMDKAFDELYFQALKNNLSIKEQKEFVKNGIAELFGNAGEILEKWIEQKFDVKLKNIALRKKRFERKAYLNNWNYFVTFTYDDKKQSEDEFKTKLRKCLNNFSSRRGWKIMGVWEYGAKEERLHFHALLHVPEGQMVGTINRVERYSKRKHKMVASNENDFFFKKFGMNDFAPISKKNLSRGKTLDYILKYISKTNEKIVYSRGIADKFIDDIQEDDVVAEMEDFVIKYILFDDVYDDENCRVEKSVDLEEFCEIEELIT